MPAERDLFTAEGNEERVEMALEVCNVPGTYKISDETEVVEGSKGKRYVRQRNGTK